MLTHTEGLRGLTFSKTPGAVTCPTGTSRTCQAEGPLKQVSFGPHDKTVVKKHIIASSQELAGVRD